MWGEIRVWRPGTIAWAVLLALLAVFASGGVAQAAPNAVSIEPTVAMVAEGESVTVDLVAEPPLAGLAGWVLEVRFDASVVTTAAGKCAPVDSPPGAVFATTCEVDDTDEDGIVDTVRVLGAVLLRAQERFGDVDCSGSVKPSDSLKILRFDAADPVPQPAGCPDIGSIVDLNSEVRLWGDVDCSGSVKPSDSLKILRFDVADPVAQPPGCPDIGGEVVVGWGLQGHVVLARITFDVVGSTGQCSALEIKQEPRLFADVSGQESSPTATDGEICVG